ncbi:MAG TPA: SHOCT domain-containing protein [Ktedonobacterales bacterium]
MRPYHYFHHPPDGYGVWHGGWLGLASLALPLLLFVLPVLAVLALLLWSSRHNFFDRLSGWLPAAPRETASAVETLRQRYARGEIDDDTFDAMLDRLNSSGREQANQDSAGDIYRETGEEEQVRPRPDLPIDWS